MKNVSNYAHFVCRFPHIQHNKHFGKCLLHLRKNKKLIFCFFASKKAPLGLLGAFYKQTINHEKTL